MEVHCLDSRPAVPTSMVWFHWYLKADMLAGVETMAHWPTMFSIAGMMPVQIEGRFWCEWYTCDCGEYRWSTGNPPIQSRNDGSDAWSCN